MDFLLKLALAFLCPGLPVTGCLLDLMHCFAFAELTLDLSHRLNSHLCGRMFQISQRPSYQFLLACQVSKSGGLNGLIVFLSLSLPLNV